MEADQIHAAIEKTKKNTTAKIDIPRDWANLIRLIPRKPSILVNEMVQEQFLGFKSLLSHKFQHKKTNTENEPVAWSKIRVLYYSTENLGQLKYGNSFSDEEVLRTLPLLRTKTRSSGTTCLLPISDKPLGIPANKLQHLKDLLPYIDETSQPYYAQFLNGLKVLPIDQEFLSDSEDDDPSIDEI